jgi:hypothetical protein
MGLKQQPTDNVERVNGVDSRGERHWKKIEGYRKTTIHSFVHYLLCNTNICETMSEPSKTTVALIAHDGVIASIKCTCGSFTFKDEKIHLHQFSGTLSFNPEPEIVEIKKEDAGKDSIHLLESDDDSFNPEPKTIEIKKENAVEDAIDLLESSESESISDDDKGSDNPDCEQLGQNLRRCVIEVYSEDDFEEDEFLSQETDLLRDIRRFAGADDFDDDSE